MAELGKNPVAQLVEVERAVVSVNNLAAGGDEDGVRERAGPLLVQRGRKIVRAAGVEVIVRAAAFALQRAFEPAGRGRMPVLEELQRARLLLGVVHADRDDLEV